jgi:hypothetical protein
VAFAFTQAWSRSSRLLAHVADDGIGLSFLLDDVTMLEDWLGMTVRENQVTSVRIGLERFRENPIPTKITGAEVKSEADAIIKAD